MTRESTDAGAVPASQASEKAMAVFDHMVMDFMTPCRECGHIMEQHWHDEREPSDRFDYYWTCNTGDCRCRVPGLRDKKI